MFEVEEQPRKFNPSNLTPCATMSRVATCAVLFEWFTQDVYFSSSVYATGALLYTYMYTTLVYMYVSWLLPQSCDIPVLSPGVLKNLTHKNRCLYKDNIKSRNTSPSKVSHYTVLGCYVMPTNTLTMYMYMTCKEKSPLHMYVKLAYTVHV